METHESSVAATPEDDSQLMFVDNLLEIDNNIELVPEQIITVEDRDESNISLETSKRPISSKCDTKNRPKKTQKVSAASEVVSYLMAKEERKKNQHQQDPFNEYLLNRVETLENETSVLRNEVNKYKDICNSMKVERDIAHAQLKLLQEYHNKDGCNKTIVFRDMTNTLNS